MGGLADVIASAVGAIQTATASLHAEVQIEHWIGPPLTFGGSDQYADPILVTGFCQVGLTHNKRSDGQVIITKAKVGLLTEIPGNPAPDRQNPLDPRDRITVSGDPSITGHMAEIPAVMTNPVTGAPYVRVLWLA